VCPRTQLCTNKSQLLITFIQPCLNHLLGLRPQCTHILFRAAISASVSVMLYMPRFSS
jgi:ABC-type Mn2+/Zn2+ transport system permease subunit